MVSSSGWIVSALALSVMAAPPVVKEGYFTTVQYETDMPLNFLVVKMDFDQNVYLKKNADNSIRPMSEMLGVSSGGFPDLAMNGIGISDLTCTNTVAPFNSINIPNTFLQPDGQPPNGPPQGYITAPPTSDPAASLLNIMFGIKLQESFVPNRYALAIPIPPNIPPESLNRMNCTVSFNTQRPFSLSNEAKESVTGSFTIRFLPPRCDLKEVEDMISFGSKVIDYAGTVKSGEELGSMINLMNSVTAREAFAGCRRLIMSWMTFKNATITAAGNRNCVYRFDQPEWSTDPCCNPELLQTQCCNPRTVTFTTKVVESFNSTTIGDRCKNPNKIGGLLTNVVEAMKGEFQEPFDFRRLFESITSFANTCTQAVFDQQCTTDADCPYSGTCGQNSICFVDYTNPGPAFVKCALAKMSDEMKLEFKSLLGLPTRYDDPDVEINEMTARILKEAESEDCAGPESQPYRRRVEYLRTNEGEFIKKETPGNETGCLLPKECSYEPWNRDTQQKCTADASQGRERFCGQCRQGFCSPISQFSRCYHSGVTSDYCSSVNGIWDQDLQFCTLPTRNTEQTCLTGPQCRNSTEPWRCDRTVCINTNINRIADCNGDYRWDWGIGKCVLNGAIFQNLQSNCNSAGLVYAPTIRYEAGRFETEQSCPSQSCDNFQVIFRGGNETDCRSVGYCTSPCSRCISFNYDDGACRNTTVSALDDCNTIGGKWLMQGSNSACIIQRTQATCSGSPLQWMDCNSLSQNTCTTSPFSQVLGCSWSQWDSCKSPEKCQAAGFCDDWEFGDAQSDGVCISEPKRPYQCDGMGATRHGWCIERLSQNQCLAPKVWKTRAKTRQECEAAGQICQLENGQRTLMNGSTCSQCGGNPLSVYNWNTPRWIYGKMVNTTWEKIEWRPKNKWIKVLDFEKLQMMLGQAAARMLSRVMVNRFTEKYSVYATIMKFAACDCIAGRTDCFGDGPIKARLKECKADPNSRTSCGGVSVPPGLFPNGTAVSINVNLVSIATFLDNRPLGNGTERSIQKARRNALTASTYEVVRNGDDSIIGQLVGNGKQFIFGTAALMNVNICLDVDPSISQDTTKYTQRDFVQSVNGVLSVPLKRNVTLEGTQLCGSVPPFTDATFLPVLRNNATLVQKQVRSSSSTAPSATAPSATATRTRLPSAAKKSDSSLLLVLLASLALL